VGAANEAGWHLQLSKSRDGAPQIHNYQELDTLDNRST
jgi:hypothetical protein